jgi:hypothetical protein
MAEPTWSDRLLAASMEIKVAKLGGVKTGRSKLFRLGEGEPETRPLGG